MGSLLLRTLLPLAAFISQVLCLGSLNVAEDSAPMVAFLCGKPAMHVTKDGWKKDQTTDCLKDPIDILNYCKDVYPDQEITNVVEASNKVTIDHWCAFGREHCSHHGSHTVRPFKCLVGAFQSEALLVPDHCVFDHIHKTEQCKTFSEWNATAFTSCHARGMVQQSFAILLPCGIHMFGGVEFVCCPKEGGDSSDGPNQKVSTNHIEKDKHNTARKSVDQTKELPKPLFSKTDTYEQDKKDALFAKSKESTSSEEYADEEFYDEDEDEEEEDYEDLDEVYSKDNTKKELPATKKPEDSQPPTDAYTEYLHNPNRYANEHEFFLRAKGELQKHHHEKVTKMMKEWGAARQRVQDMKETDPKAAEKLNREITARFQKTYEALEEEGMAEKKQLVALHQQRVQAQLNEKKRHAMEHYMASLQKNKPDAGLILKSLEHYIKTEQKDREHTVNHFKHLRDTEPAEAERVRQQTLDHLAIIDQRIAQSIDMLNRVPDYSKKIRLQIDDFLKTFHELDTSIEALLMKPIPQLPAKANAQDNSFYKKIQMKKLPDLPNLMKSHAIMDDVKPPLDHPKNNAEKLNNDEKMVPEKPEKIDEKMLLHKVPLEKTQLKPEQMDIASEEDDDVYVKEYQQPAHQSVNNLAQKEASYIHREPMKPSKYQATGSTMGIAVGCIAVFVVIVVGIVVLRRKAQRVPVNHGFVEVDQAASPEERHVANMQINGYENPTYKYFEMNGNAA